MARTRTLTNLIGDVRLRADNQSLQDADITEFINQSITKLYWKLSNAYGNEYFEVETNLTTTPNVATVNLPADFWQLTGLYWVNGTYKYRITKMAPMESENWIAGVGWNTFFDVHYIPQKSALKFVPVPLGTHTVTLKYIPCATRLSAPGDTFDGYNGFEDWVVIDAAMKCLRREGDEVAANLLQPDLAAIDMQIDQVKERDQSEPMRVQDTAVGGPWWRRNWR